MAEEEDAQIEAATRRSLLPGVSLDAELAWLDEMAEVARRSRYDADTRVRYLIGWIRTHLCPDLGTPGAAWLPRRVLIFTEYADTKRYLEQQLRDALRGSDRDSERVATFHGGIGEERREAIKAAFNLDPLKHPLRILIATDAAREGVNLQNNCADLFHFDVPWNPSRIEQRNGRVDRKLQQAPVVTCAYFVLPQRAEDRVLDVLVQKTRRIHEELGSLPPVIEQRVDRVFAQGIDHAREGELTHGLEQVDQDDTRPGARVQTLRSELGFEVEDKRRAKLKKQLADLERLLDESRAWIGLDDRHFLDALSSSLELLGAGSLRAVDPEQARQDAAHARWQIPNLHQRTGADPTWAATLDSLRAPRAKGQSLAEWRRDAPIRPVVLRDPGNLDGEVVHLHLEHRVVRRLLLLGPGLS